MRFVASTPRLYAEAWIVSLAVSAIGAVIVPLTPWLLFWSYLFISHVFLQAAAGGSLTPALGRIARSGRLQAPHANPSRAQQNR